ncbi:MAG: RluA family pseudouridine synthase [Bacteroides sp.]
MARKQRPIARARNKYTNYRVNKPSTLMEFLQEKMPEASRTKIKSFLSRRIVHLNKKIVSHPDTPVDKGMLVQIDHSKRRNQGLSNRELTIIYEDAYLIVIEKKPNVLSITSANSRGKSAHATLSHYVKRDNHRNQVHLIHKFEKDESGLMIFAKDEETKFNFQNNWKEFIINHTFVGLVEGEFPEEKGVIVSWIDEQTGELIFSDYVEEDPKHTAIRAITRYKRIKQANGLSLMEFDPREDRNNKIRIQMAHKGYPVLGDKMHGEYKSPIRRLALHAFLLRFRHPVTRELMKFELPYPKDFRSLVTKINPTKE